MAITILRTGFFDLPREFRDQIYNSVLPYDRMLTLSYKKHRRMERRFWDMCKADHRVRRELGLYGMKRCGWRVIISRNNPLPPKNLHFNKPCMIEIYIAKYDPRSTWLAIIDIRAKIAGLVDMFKRYKHLPYISVRFEPTDGKCWRGCNQDYTLGCGCDFNCNSIVEPDTPLIEYVLGPLERLPSQVEIHIMPPCLDERHNLLDEMDEENGNGSSAPSACLRVCNWCDDLSKRLHGQPSITKESSSNCTTPRTQDSM